MRKKIIYLLSLLMALSLVFASCKKNGAGDINGPGPGDNGFDNSPTTENGLAPDQDWLDSNSEKPIKNDEIPNFQSIGGTAYFRNPVVVVMGSDGSDVVVFAEKRYKSLGADNDIGVDGKTATDIVSITSLDAGKKWGTPAIVGRNTEATTENAVASPVVFKIDNSTVVVVASAGAGLSRTSQDYDQRNPQSKLMYAIGTYKDGTFTWTKTWTDMTDTIKTKVNASTVVNQNSLSYKQFAVHSGRGFVNNSTLYLAVTIADQGASLPNDNEAMGNIIFKANYTSNSADLTWEEVSSSAVAFNMSSKNNYSSYKESRVISVTSDSDIKYIAVGNPYAGNNFIGYAKKSEQPKNTIAGSEGSPAYLEIKDWRGATSYNPTEYNPETTGSKQQKLFAHVKDRNSTITMYGVGDNFTQNSAKTYTVIGFPKDDTTLAKSSSMDVLGDGTIVMVAEQGGSEKQYKIVCKRFTQKFLATQLGLQ